jgi:hypothetical protein
MYHVAKKDMNGKSLAWPRRLFPLKKFIHLDFALGFGL